MSHQPLGTPRHHARQGNATRSTLPPVAVRPPVGERALATVSWWAAPVVMEYACWRPSHRRRPAATSRSPPTLPAALRSLLAQLSWSAHRVADLFAPGRRMPCPHPTSPGQLTVQLRKPRL